MFRAVVAVHNLNNKQVSIAHKVAANEKEVVVSILEEFGMDTDIADGWPTLKELQDFGYEADLMIIYEIRQRT
jgi:hypothetical protein